MGFLDSYKWLDNLCKDYFQSDTGVSSYIKEMEQCSSLAGKISNWDSDYQNLKHYRYVRNQIVHDNWASENTLCDTDDVLWLEEFHQRILNQTDPLSLYQKAISRVPQQAQKKPVRKQSASEPKQKQRRSFGWIYAIIIAAALCALIYVCWRYFV